MICHSHIIYPQHIFAYVWITVVDEQEETTAEVKTIMQSSVPEESPADELTADHTHQHDQVSPIPSGRTSDASEQIL